MQYSRIDLIDYTTSTINFGFASKEKSINYDSHCVTIEMVIDTSICKWQTIRYPTQIRGKKPPTKYTVTKKVQ